MRRRGYRIVIPGVDETGGFIPDSGTDVSERLICFCTLQGPKIYGEPRNKKWKSSSAAYL